MVADVAKVYNGMHQTKIDCHVVDPGAKARDGSRSFTRSQGDEHSAVLTALMGLYKEAHTHIKNTNCVCKALWCLHPTLKA
jgi:hypothetical protein